MVGYVTAVLAFVRVGAPAVGRETSIFWDFLKVTSCDFTPFYSFLLKQTFVFWDVLGKEYYG